MINHCDVRRGVCATNLNAKEKKRSFAKKQQRYKTKFELETNFRFTNKMLTAEQKQQITENYTHINYSNDKNSLFRDSN